MDSDFFDMLFQHSKKEGPIILKPIWIKKQSPRTP